MIPHFIPNQVNGQEVAAAGADEFTKVSPHDGSRLCRVARSRGSDVQAAVAAARAAASGWAETPAVTRGLVLHSLVRKLQDNVDVIAEVVAAETGKSLKDAKNETAGAIQLGLFYASEGQRLYGRTTTSGGVNKYAMTVRQPIGVAGLVVAANTPIANVAWKVFPALICGNTAVLKAAEDTPATAWLFGCLATEAGVPPGVLNIIQGYGAEAGEPLVEHPDVGVVSFTGSTRVGRIVQQKAGIRFARISLELGGKNPFVVCDDADLENAVKWALLSAFSNAGQRCAAASRILVFEAVYRQFRSMLLDATLNLKVGPADTDAFGPVINEAQLIRLTQCVDEARADGAIVLAGGHRLTGPEHAKGFYFAPTLIEQVDADAAISKTELFGPIALIYSVKDYLEAEQMANQSPYGLTACIHTCNVHRAWRFCDKVQAGVAIVNAGTFGSEPHMPFGGRKLSGNGSREPGTEGLNVYSELKNVYLNIDPVQL